MVAKNLRVIFTQSAREDIGKIVASWTDAMGWSIRARYLKGRAIARRVMSTCRRSRIFGVGSCRGLDTVTL